MKIYTERHYMQVYRLKQVKAQTSAGKNGQRCFGRNALHVKFITIIAPISPTSITLMEHLVIYAMIILKVSFAKKSFHIDYPTCHNRKYYADRLRRYTSMYQPLGLQEFYRMLYIYIQSIQKRLFAKNYEIINIECARDDGCSLLRLLL